MGTDVEIPVEERVYRLLRHLGLEQAHFAAREFLEFDALVRVHRDIVASLTLVLPPRTLNVETLRPLATRLLCFYGGKGPNAQYVRQSLAMLPLAETHCLEDYPDVLWADVIADRTEYIGEAMLDFLARMDLQAALRTASLASGEGEVAGIRYRILGSGPPLVLLPLVLSPSQWEPLLARLSERYCTIVLGGPELGGVRQLEARGRSQGHRRVLERFLAEVELKPGERVLEVGCGSGVFTRLMAQSMRGECPIVAVDINRYFLREAVALAQKTGYQNALEFHEASAEALPFEDNAFETCLATTVMEEVDADRMLAQMIRVTKPGGRVGVIVRAEDMNSWTSVPLEATLKAKAELPRGNVADKGCADGSLYRRFRDAGLVSLKMFPQLAPFKLSEPHGKRMEAGILAALSPEEAVQWRAAAESPGARDFLFIARPFHCAVGTKPPAKSFATGPFFR
ncbi:MAG: methyltransferase domain-containing protein [Deltaproteobacteria bacterium]|nr:methyltransferase domain-containing protein [Deltaproteobacteria bacterium]